MHIERQKDHLDEVSKKLLKKEDGKKIYRPCDLV